MDSARQGEALQRPFSIPKTSLIPSCSHGQPTSFINPKLSGQAFEAVLAFFHSPPLFLPHLSLISCVPRCLSWCPEF